ASTTTLDLIGSTVNAVGGRALYIVNTSKLSLGLQDTVLAGQWAISGNMTSGLVGNAQGTNVLHRHSGVATFTAMTLDITGYKTTFNDPNAKDLPPMFAGDNFHLAPGSPLVDLTMTTSCSTNQDVDGETRPKGAACDVGADEQ